MAMTQRYFAKRWVATLQNAVLLVGKMTIMITRDRTKIIQTAYLPVAG
jgi:hypothetical protein